MDCYRATIVSLSCLRGGQDKVPLDYRHLADFPVLFPKRARSDSDVAPYRSL
jgi:hypothetical protein